MKSPPESHRRSPSAWACVRIALALACGAAGPGFGQSTPLAAPAPASQSAPVAPASEAGQWSELFAFPSLPIHGTVLPDGSVLSWDRHDFPTGDGHPRRWNPETGAFTLTGKIPPGHDLFCSGHALLADGRLLVAGGHYDVSIGQPFASIFDPLKSTWTMVPEMRRGRWYPSLTTLADGRVLALAGGDEDGAANELPEVFDPGTLNWAALDGAKRVLPYYPLAFQAPDGSVVVVAPDETALRLDLTPPGAWQAVASSGHGLRTYASAVSYGDGKILLAGGGDPPLAAAQVLDLRQPTPTFREVAPMSAARRHFNLTLLPDGTAMAIGGSSAAGFNNATGAVLATELWNPVTESWTPLAPIAAARIYHSIALLLPDGRVLSAGGGHPSDAAHGDPDHFDGQIYSPPYLFHGPRPEIDDAPEEIPYGANFEVTADEGPAIVALTWLRLGSTTHGFDMNQRFLRLETHTTAKGVTAKAPADPRLAPPGHYWMFALSADGVPSVARLVRLDLGLFRDGFESGSTAAWPQVLP